MKRIIRFYGQNWLQLNSIIKVRTRAKIRNRYKQVPHLIWESDNKHYIQESQVHHIQESQNISPVSAGDRKSARHRQGNMAKTNTKQKRSTKEVSPWNTRKLQFWRDLTSFRIPTAPLNAGVDQDTYMFVSHEMALTYL